MVRLSSSIPIRSTDSVGASQPSAGRPRDKDSRTDSPSSEQIELVRWVAGLGAVTAGSYATLWHRSLASARGRLNVAVRAGLLRRHDLLIERPSLYTVTRAGLRRCAIKGIDPCRVSAATAHHLIACSEVCAWIACCYPDQRVMGERELRREERLAGRLLASANLGLATMPALGAHRPDLVLWPDAGVTRMTVPSPSPVVVEVELTVKAPRRLTEICRAWARCRLVAGVLYIAAPEVEAPLRRAVSLAHGDDRIAIVAVEAMPGKGSA